MVHVKIDGREMTSLVGTDEIEQYTELQGTVILGTGTTSKTDILVQVIIDSEDRHEIVIDLSTGGYIHIYMDPEELSIINTNMLVFE
jgi:hypothetical protein